MPPRVQSQLRGTLVIARNVGLLSTCEPPYRQGSLEVIPKALPRHHRLQMHRNVSACGNPYRSMRYLRIREVSPGVSVPPSRDTYVPSSRSLRTPSLTQKFKACWTTFCSLTRIRAPISCHVYRSVSSQYQPSPSQSPRLRCPHTSLGKCIKNSRLQWCNFHIDRPVLHVYRQLDRTQHIEELKMLVLLDLAERAYVVFLQSKQHRQ